MAKSFTQWLAEEPEPEPVVTTTAAQARTTCQTYGHGDIDNNGRCYSCGAYVRSYDAGRVIRRYNRGI